MDEDGDGKLTPEEITRHFKGLEHALGRKLVFTSTSGARTAFLTPSSRAIAHTNSLSLSRSPTNTRTYTYIHTHTYIHAHAYTHTYMHAQRGSTLSVLRHRSWMKSGAWGYLMHPFLFCDAFIPVMWCIHSLTSSWVRCLLIHVSNVLRYHSSIFSFRVERAWNHVWAHTDSQTKTYQRTLN